MPEPATPNSFERIALVLQGGGALGSYQAGVFQALDEAGVTPHWLAGISIGAINAALVAGNPPGKRVERLQEFWETVTSDWAGAGGELPFSDMIDGDLPRELFSRWSAFVSLAYGRPGFFRPRLPPAWAHLPGSGAATSVYDTADLRSTLERLVDFDRLNDGEIRVSVGATNVRSGNFEYFDTRNRRLGPEHIMASGALPPGLPAVEIEGELYWDGGIVSNTPLAYVVQSNPAKDTLCFQVDLWNSKGELPRDLGEVQERQKEIQYSSRTRLVTDLLRRRQTIGRLICELLDKLPPELATSSEAVALRPHVHTHFHNIVHLIYRAKHHEIDSKDYEFSRYAMRSHWKCGYNDALEALRHPEIFVPGPPERALTTFDFG